MEYTRQPKIWISIVLFLVLATAGFIATHVSVFTIIIVALFLGSGGFIFFFLGKKFDLMYLGLPALGFILGSIFYYSKFYEPPSPSLDELANLGDPDAQYSVGLLGLVTQDKESLKHLYSSAQKGNSDAQYIIGITMQLSDKDSLKSHAYKWLLLSSRGGNSEASERIKEWEPELSPEIKVLGEKLANEWQDNQ